MQRERERERDSKSKLLIKNVQFHGIQFTNTINVLATFIFKLD